MNKSSALVYFNGPVIFVNFGNLIMEADRGQVYKGMGAGSGGEPGD